MAPDLDFAEDEDEALGLPEDDTSAPVVAPAPSTLSPALRAYLASKAELGLAQEQVRDNQLVTGLSSALAQLGHGISGKQGNADLSGIQAMAQADDSPVKNYIAGQQAGLQAQKAAQALQADDPNDPGAARLRAVYAPLFAKAGLDPKTLDGLSASQIKSYAEKPLEFIHKQKTAEATRGAYKERTDAIRTNADGRRSTADIKAAASLMGDPNMKRETTKLQTARSAQALLEEIRAGKLVDSKNISKQLTNMIATIEMGTPGGVQDRQNMGVDTLYSNLKDTLGYVTGNPESRIPAEYLDQLESEVHALGDRAAANFKNLTDAALKGSDLSGLDPEADPGRVYGLAKQRQQELLRANGYDPETGARTGGPKHGSPPAVGLSPEKRSRLEELRKKKAGQ